jgi:hypothetical protein
MSGLWTFTWHEDREISPGVPDASYVMSGTGYETGWLELKATHMKEGPYRFKVEPSQHRWIDAHCDKVPVDFLIASAEKVWLVPGFSHKLFLETVTDDEMNRVSHGWTPRQDLRVFLNKHLRRLTDRSR